MRSLRLWSFSRSRSNSRRRNFSEDRGRLELSFPATRRAVLAIIQHKLTHSPGFVQPKCTRDLNCYTKCRDRAALNRQPKIHFTRGRAAKAQSNALRRASCRSRRGWAVLWRHPRRRFTRMRTRIHFLRNMQRNAQGHILSFWFDAAVAENFGTNDLADDRLVDELGAQRIVAPAPPTT